MSNDALLWLLTVEAEELLSESVAAIVDPATLTALRKRLAGGQDAVEKAAALLDLAELRRHAAAKFPRAERMFFTRKAYEQATDAIVARYKAERFGGTGRVLDACCGMGGDLIGLAEVVPECVGIDADPVLARYAERNVRACDRQARVESFHLDRDNLPDSDAWHVDPDRRPDGHRTTDPNSHQPSLDTLEAWRRRIASGAVKLAPAARLPEAWNATAELEWISHRSECRQLVAWVGPLAKRPGKRRATRIAAGTPAASFVGLPGIEAPVAAKLGDWVHEPDPAVLAADLQGDLANQHSVAPVAPGIAYLTSNQAAETPLLASFRVTEAMPLDRKRLARWLSERDIGRLEIKVRGAEVRPEALRKTLKPKGSQSATLLIYPNAEGKTQVLIADRAPTATEEKTRLP